MSKGVVFQSWRTHREHVGIQLDFDHSQFFTSCTLFHLLAHSALSNVHVGRTVPCRVNRPPNPNELQVRTGARQHHLLNPLYIQTEKLLREYESSSKLNELFEDVARAEMNLPPRDSNIEIVDMEVSSGPSSIASTCSSSLSNNGANNAEGSGADAPNPEEFDKSKDVLDDENESIPLDSILCPPPPPMQPNAPIKTKPAIHHSNEPTQPGVKRPLNDPIINDEDADQAGSSETKRPRF